MRGREKECGSGREGREGGKDGWMDEGRAGSRGRWREREREREREQG